MSKTSEKIIKNKIVAVERALKTNNQEFIRKWHGNRSYAEMDLEELKARLNSFQNGNDWRESTHAGKKGGIM